MESAGNAKRAHMLDQRKFQSLLSHVPNRRFRTALAGLRALFFQNGNYKTDVTVSAFRQCLVAASSQRLEVSNPMCCSKWIIPPQQFCIIDVTRSHIDVQNNSINIWKRDIL